MTRRSGRTSVRAMTGRAFLTRWQRAALTAVIAYALALQALSFSFGGAVHAQASLSEGVICAQSSEHSKPHGPAQAHDALCCILGCNLSAAFGGPPLVQAGLARLALTPATISFSPDRADPVRLVGFLPVGSRAPPRPV
ncbi:DUF2946 family protein [Microvirga rosea]|uniref:DUF2946 family protein n=1 Tax=Microvirga rosea TaxID=2715425 RepID=UPI001D0A606B|nr:DUF2946 family protein [Microvirga rosea]MCB8819181.1 hypothetical protein [Microvirga rosea]